MNTKLPTRARMDERIALVLPSDEKRKLFEVAAERGTTVSAMVRAAVGQVLGAAPQRGAQMEAANSWAPRNG